MQHRRLGRTGLDVSVLTLNARGLDAGACKDLDLAVASAAFALALDGGVNAIAASPAHGEAERLVGGMLRSAGRAGQVHVLSQVPPLTVQDLPSPHLHADHVFPGRHIRASTEASLKALGVERLAVQILPAWQAEWTREGDWLETCLALKAEGKIAGFGVAPFDHDPGAAMEVAGLGQIDCVEVMYNLFDPEAAEALFPLALEKDIGIIARSPLYGGAITPGWGAAPFPTADWRGDFFYPDHLAETRDRVAALEGAGGSVSDLALRFALSHPAVSTVSVGMRTRGHVEANLAAAAKGPLPAGVLLDLAQHRWLC